MWQMIMITVAVFAPDIPSVARATHQGFYETKVSCEQNMMDRYSSVYTSDERGSIKREGGDLVFFYKGWDYHNTLRCIRIN